MTFLNRLSRIVGSLAVVVAAWWLYALLMVPLIEPSAETQAAAASTAEERGRAAKAVDNQRADLKHWFKEGDWELTSPKILEGAQGMVLLKTYENLEGNRVRIRPCTMIFMPQGRFANDEERKRRAIVLRAPEGAILQFDEKFDLKRAKIGQLTGGQLVGAVRIDSDQRSPGPEDDLHIETRDVTLAQDRITTPHAIRFQFGPNRGSGRQMQINLAAGSISPGQSASKRRYGGVTSFQLAEDVRVRIEPGDSDLFPGGAKPAAHALALTPKPGPPVEIKSQGPFHFDLLNNVATFTDRVDVLRLNAEGPSDQITCELLSLYFEEEAAPAGAASTQPRLRPSRISARGAPVIVNSPSKGVHACGERLDYDIKKRSGSLRDKRESLLRQDAANGGRQEIHGQELYFEPDPQTGRPATFLAKGAGWLKGQAPSAPGQPAGMPLEASWTKSLHFRPHEQNQVLSVKGEAHVQSAATGSLDADEIHFWLRPAPTGGGKSGFAPDRVWARGHARVDSPQLVAALDQMQIWFVAETPEVAPAPPTPPGPSLASPAVSGPPKSSTPAAPPAVAAQSQPVAARSSQRFHISANSLRARMLVRGPKTEVSEAVLDGQVRCEETQTALPGERPLILSGDRLHLSQPNPESVTATVQGTPAKVNARGLGLQGDKIHLDRALNKVWIDGGGQLTLLTDQSLDGKALSAPQPVEVTWQGRMEFDGRSALFERDVQARLEQQRLRTQTLQVNFLRDVRLGAAGAKDKPEVDYVECRNGAYLENRGFESGRLTNVERVQAQNLTLEQRTGDVTAGGPGWVTRLWRGDATSSLGLGGGEVKPVRKPLPQQGVDGPIQYLCVEFERELTGNQKRQAMEFHQNVRSIFGQAPDWESRLDPERPEQLGDAGFVMNCDQLNIARLGLAEGKPLYELAATGNTLVEGSTFTARASRLTYATGKELLVLEGNGRTDAQLFRQDRPGGPTSQAAARKILYWRKTERVEVDDARFLDLSDLTGQKQRR